jgi:hypothetical protein
VYSPTLASQIPESYAASAFNVFRLSMHQIEIVRLCAIWDTADIDKENIATVIELIDNENVIKALAEETRSQWTGVGGHIFNPSSDPALAAEERAALDSANNQFGNEQASKAETELTQAKNDARAILNSQRLASVMIR